MAGESVDRLPMEVCVNIVEPTLNPPSYVSYYDDKNTLPSIMPYEWLPITYLRSIHGQLCDDSGHTIMDGEKVLTNIPVKQIIVKPSCEMSGRGVVIFRCNEDGIFENKYGEPLSISLLKQRWKDDWLVQECIEQSNEFAQFNPTSINTLRIATYRSLDGCIYPIGHVLRIGNKGADVDNAHAGGMFCGVDSEGYLGKYFSDALARTRTIFNGIDLSTKDYQISNMETIRNFVCNAAYRIRHHDLVAFDIAITKDGTPKIIEINIGGFGAWVFEMTAPSTFGQFTEEVIQRCLNSHYSSFLRLFEL